MEKTSCFFDMAVSIPFAVAFALALQAFNGKKGFYFTKKSYHKTVSFCHGAEGCGLLYI